jgi:NTE family protein
MTMPSKPKTTSAPAAASAAIHEEKTVNLALQGGGSHGAFTWGMLDRFLQEPRLNFDGVCGTSAGAMNAAVLTYGLARGGRQAARERLDDFWRRIAEAGRKGPLQRSPFDKMMGGWRLDHSPSFMMFDLLSRMMSPYQLNPMNINPLRDLLEEAIDFEVIRKYGGVKLFICATNVRTGKVKVFKNDEMVVECLLASACLPFLFQTVELDGEHYWDGGYMGNPALFPIIYACASKDIVIAQINPLYREEIPTSARDIMDRVNEISFNSSLMREMRAVHFVTKLIDGGKLDPEEYKRLNIHIVASQGLNDLGASTKLNSEPDFLEHLKRLGSIAADSWLEQNWGKIGVESSVDLVETYF